MSTKMNRAHQQPYVKSGEDGGEYRAYGYGGHEVPKGAYSKAKIPVKKQEESITRTKEEQEFIESVMGEKVAPIEKPVYVKKTFEELKKDNDLAIADWFKPDLSFGKRWDGGWDFAGRETEKAVLVLFFWESVDGEYDGTETSWMPKSAFISAKYKRDYEQWREYRLQTAMEEGFNKNLRLKKLAIDNGILKETDKRKHNMMWFARKLTEIGKQDEVIKIIGEKKFNEFGEINKFVNAREEALKVYQQVSGDKRKKATLDYWSAEKIIKRIGEYSHKLTDEQKAVVEKMKGLINERNNH